MPENVILLSNVRLSFPHLVEPQRQPAGENGKEKISYNCELLMPPDHPGFAQFWKRYGEMALEKWKEHAGPVMNLIATDRKKRCYGQGTEKINSKTFQPFDGYVGMVYLTAGRETPPQVIQSDGTPIDPSNTMAYQSLTRAMYGGCRVNVAVKPWLQDNKHGRGVRLDLVAIQFAGDDAPFGEGAVDASGLFGAVAAAPTGAPSPAGMPAFMGAPAVPQAPVAPPAPAMPAPPFAQAPAAPQNPFPQAPTVPGLPSFLS